MHPLLWAWPNSWWVIFLHCCKSFFVEISISLHHFLHLSIIVLFIILVFAYNSVNTYILYSIVLNWAQCVTLTRGTHWLLLFFSGTIFSFETHPRLTYVANLAYHVHIKCLLADFHNRRRRAQRWHYYSQQGCQAADRRVSTSVDIFKDMWGYFQTFLLQLNRYF